MINPTIGLLGNRLVVQIMEAIDAEALTKGEAMVMLEEIIYELQNPRLEMRAKLAE